MVDTAIAYKLIQIVDEPTPVPGLVGNHANLLDLFLMTSPDKCNVTFIGGSSDHSLTCVKTDAKPKGHFLMYHLILDI